MTDEELIKRLRAYAQIEHASAPWGFAGEGEVLSTAADRIEALVKERDEAVIRRAAWELEAKTQQARAERLEAALMTAVDFIEDLKGHEWPLDVQAERILAEIGGVTPRRYMGQIMAECDCSRQEECLATGRCAALKGADGG